MIQVREAVQKTPAGWGWGAGTEGEKATACSFLKRCSKQLTVTCTWKSFLTIARGRQFPGKKTSLVCWENESVNAQGLDVLLKATGLYSLLLCRVRWWKAKYMPAIFDHHLLYWFVSRGTVIKKPLIYCPYLLMGFFLLLIFHFLSLSLFLGGHFFQTNAVLREVRREGVPVEQRAEIVTAVLAALTTRQTLRREWHARSVLLRNRPWKRKNCDGLSPNGRCHPSRWRGHEKQARYRCSQPKWAPVHGTRIHLVIHSVLCMCMWAISE